MHGQISERLLKRAADATCGECAELLTYISDWLSHASIHALKKIGYTFFFVCGCCVDAKTVLYVYRAFVPKVSYMCTLLVSACQVPVPRSAGLKACARSLGR